MYEMDANADPAGYAGADRPPNADIKPPMPIPTARAVQ